MLTKNAAHIKDRLAQEADKHLNWSLSRVMGLLTGAAGRLSFHRPY